MARILRRRCGSLLLLTLLSSVLVVPATPASAGAASATPVRVAPLGAAANAARSAGSPGGRTEQEPTSAELDQQRAQVARLKAEAERRASGVGDARAAVQGAAVLAGQALEEYAGAVRSLRAQQQLEQQQQTVLSQAQADLERSRRDLGRWARQAYSNGTGIGGSSTVTAMLLTDRAEDVATNLSVLRRIGRDRGRSVAGLQVARQQADRAADAAATASAQAADAAVAATAAKQASEEAVNAQRRLLGLAESSLTRSQDEVTAAVAREAGLRAALLAQTPAPTGGSGASKDNRVTGAVGSCTGAAVEQYANGQIPVSALCPLRAATGHYLRADAAYAFDRLGQAYASRFGTAVCVTDSYRSYAAQVSVFARKPGLAAVPGTSNHGWGTAVDLCGGIQSFSSAQHRWMSENAALYGWFHPGWAQAGGSKPEPWHWEYGG